MGNGKDGAIPREDLGRHFGGRTAGPGLARLAGGAAVRAGPGVRIGGHDISNRRDGSVHVERVRRLRGPLGCRHRRNRVYRRGDGTIVRGPMERCNLIAIPPARRR